MPPSAQQPDLATLRAIVDAVRRGPPPAGRATQVAPTPLIALLALLLAGFLHARAFHAWTPRPASVPPAEEFPVKTVREMAVVSSFALASACLAQDAVQWRVEDGGNGHWYEGVVLSPSTSWLEARYFAEAQGGHSATFTSIEEFDWVRDNIASNSALWYRTWGPFIGGIQSATGAEPIGGWSWITGEEWLPIWGPNNCGADNTDNHDALALGICNSVAPIAYSDAGINTPGFGPGSVHAAVIVEWSADCNGDGIVDYGQIRAGELDDADADNIPDCCESATPCPCEGDIDRSGAVNGVDLSIILNAWGVGGGKYPEADVNGDGTVDAVDLSFVLNAWGPCS